MVRKGVKSASFSNKTSHHPTYSTGSTLQSSQESERTMHETNSDDEVNGPSDSVPQQALLSLASLELAAQSRIR